MQAVYVLLIILGLFLCVGGIFFRKPILVITGFVNGLFIGAIILLLTAISFNDISTGGAIAMVLVISLLIAGLSMLLERIFTAISAFISSFTAIALAIILSSGNIVAGFVVALICAIALSVISYIFYKYSFAVVTSFTGGLSAGLGVNGLVTGYELYSILWGDSEGLGIVIGIALALTVAGTFVQIKGIGSLGGINRDSAEGARHNFEGKNIGGSINSEFKEKVKQLPMILIVPVAIFIITAIIGIIQNASEWSQWYTWYYYVRIIIENIAVACLTYITLRDNNKTACIIIQAAYVLSWLVQNISEFGWNVFGSIVAMFAMTIVWLIGWFIRSQINDTAWKPLFAIGVTSIIYTIVVPAVQYKGYYFSWYTIVSIAVAIAAFACMQKIDDGSNLFGFISKNRSGVSEKTDERYSPYNDTPPTWEPGTDNRRRIKIIIACVAAAIIIGAIVVVIVNVNNHSDTNAQENGQYGEENPDYSYDSYASYEEYADDFIFYDSNCRYLEDYEVSSLSEDDIQMAINEIYARKGVNFENEPYVSHFNSCEWYNPIYSQAEFDSSWFNEYEEANVNLLAYYRNNNTENGEIIIDSEDEALDYAIEYANKEGIYFDSVMIDGESDRGYTVRGYEDMGDYINTMFLWTIEPNGDIYDEQNWYWVYQN